MRDLSGNSLVVLLLVASLAGGCGKPDAASRVEYTKEDGKKTSDITAIKDGTAAYEVIGKRSIPAKAKQLHNEARTKGQSGDYESAIKLLSEAIATAPDWAYPHYDMAFTYLLQGDSAKALTKYRATDRLEPEGFFTTKTAVWSLEREENGSLPKGTYLAYVSLEWAEPGKKREVIDRMITNTPSFAPVWKEKALLTQDPEERLRCFDKALSLDPDPETQGICILNKAALLYSSGKKVEAKRMVDDLVGSPASTGSTKALATQFLKTFKQ